jgi:hypothetical protein
MSRPVEPSAEIAMSGHGHVEGSNKRLAILIAVLAAMLAISETVGKSAQTSALNSNLDASNLWAFFQAKTIRQTVVRTAADDMEASGVEGMMPERAAITRKRIDDWRATAQRYEDEAQPPEGRKQLRERALAAETARDHHLAAYHQFEFGSAAFQLAIVLASAAAVTAAAWLGVASVVLGVVGIGFTVLGFVAPHLIHF